MPSMYRPHVHSLHSTQPSVLQRAPRGVALERGLVAAAMAGALALLLASVPARAQEPDSTATPAPAEAEAPASSGRPSLTARAIPSGAERQIRLDGRLTEPEWRDADSIGGLTEVEPKQGRKPKCGTTVRVLASPTGIVIGFHCCEDSSLMYAITKARDVELDEEDHVVIVLDTFGDDRSGFVFAVNPLGAQWIDGEDEAGPIVPERVEHDDDVVLLVQLHVPRLGDRVHERRVLAAVEPDDDAGRAGENAHGGAAFGLAALLGLHLREAADRVRVPPLGLGEPAVEPDLALRSRRDGSRRQ